MTKRLSSIVGAQAVNAYDLCERDGRAGSRTARFNSTIGALDSTATNITIYGWDNANELVSVKTFDTYAHYTDYLSGGWSAVDADSGDSGGGDSGGSDSGGSGGSGGTSTPIAEGEVDYAYAVDGLMVTRNTLDASGDSTSGEFYINDGAQVALVLNAAGQVTERELYGPAVDQVMASEYVTPVSGGGPQSAGTTSFMLPDFQGSVRDVLQASVYTSGGATLVNATDVDHLDYDAFGSILNQTDASAQPRNTYTGRQYDAATGLYYYRARWYDPVTGAWICNDPLGFNAGQTNLQEYVGNDPVNYVDPSGMDANASSTLFYQFGSDPAGANTLEYRFDSPTPTTTTLPFLFGSAPPPQADGEAVGLRDESSDSGGPTPAPVLASAPQMSPPVSNAAAARADILRLLGSDLNNVSNEAMNGVGNKYPGLASLNFDSHSASTYYVSIPGEPGGVGQVYTFVRQYSWWGLGTPYWALASINPEMIPGVESQFNQQQRVGIGRAGAELQIQVSGAILNAVAAGWISLEAAESLLWCFPAGTPVATPSGLLPIEQIKVGNEVWAFDLVRSQWFPRTVLRTFVSDHDGTSATIIVAGEEIEATALHPFWVVSGTELATRPIRDHLAPIPKDATTTGRWVDAIDVRVGDELLLRDGRILPVEAVRQQPYHDKVYNFHVDDLQCYAVGKLGALVHNINDLDLIDLTESQVEDAYQWWEQCQQLVSETERLQEWDQLANAQQLLNEAQTSLNNTISSLVNLYSMFGM